MSIRFPSRSLWLLPVLLAVGCSGKSAAPNSAFEAGCAPPAGVDLSKPQVDAAIASIKSLFTGKLSFDVDSTVVRVLTDSRRADLIVASLMCTAEKRGAMTSTDGARVEYTRQLFLYTWGTSPLPGPEDVQAWTTSHPYANVKAHPTPSAAAVPFAEEHLDVTDLNTDACTRRVIPAGVSVCVRAPAASTVEFYAAEAPNHGLMLTSLRTGQSANWLKQNIDYAVCARLPSDPPQGSTPQQSPIALDIAGQTREQCLGAQPTETPAITTAPEAPPAPAITTAPETPPAPATTTEPEAPAAPAATTVPEAPPAPPASVPETPSEPAAAAVPPRPAA